MNGVADACENVDGIVCVAHTEGGEERTPNNLDLLLRTLGGFMVNPNVGAVLVLDHGGEEAVTNRDAPGLPGGARLPDRRRAARVHEPGGELQERSRTGQVRRARMVGGGGRGAAHGGACFRAQDRAAVRRFGRLLGGLREPARGLGERGRSSGTAACANLAETDELIGAEHYVLQNVRDLKTAKRFLSAVERFKERVSLARPHGRGQPFRGQQLPRALQHLHQVHRGGDEEAPRRADRPRDRVRREDGRGRLLLYGQPGQRPGERRRTGRRWREHDLLHHRATAPSPTSPSSPRSSSSPPRAATSSSPKTWT